MFLKFKIFFDSPSYTGELNLETFGIEMKQAFKLYPRDVAVMMANNMVETEKENLSSKKIQS